MGQKLYVMKGDSYRLDVDVFDDPIFLQIKRGDSKYNYRLSIKEKFSDRKALESYVADVKDDKLGFDLKPQLSFGMYLYVIELISAVSGRKEDELAYGFIEILPDVTYPGHSG